jgi:hypothetical protein
MAVRDQVKGKVVWGWRVGVLALAVAVGPSCGDLTKSGQSAAYLMIDDLTGVSGATGDEGNTLSSDVVTEGGVIEDGGKVVIRLGLKDPGSPSAPNTPTFNNYITVTRYRVEYKRSDGRNTPGVDVPYPFDGGISFTAVGGTTTGSFVLVRAQAKLEPPLLNLRYLGGSVVISTIADVTFYGHDQTGIPVSATGSISVNFADWADPEG